jgi:hypothetical protein
MATKKLRKRIKEKDESMKLNFLLILFLQKKKLFRFSGLIFSKHAVTFSP